MEIVFSEHAEKQIKRRKIPKKLISKVVRDYQEIKRSFRGRKLRRSRVGGKILEVVTRTEGSRITIVTAYYLEEKL